MSLSVRQSGVWKPVIKAWVKQSGVWKQAIQLSVRQSGVWKPTLVTGSFTPISQDYHPYSIGGIGQITFYNDGSIIESPDYVPAPPAGWGTPIGGTPGTGYWINVQAGSGFGTNGGGIRNSWIPISTSPSFYISSAPFGFARTRTATYQIASDSAGTTIVASGTMYFVSDNL